MAEVRIRGDVRRILPMPDGSFILGGYTAYYNGVRETQLLRVMPNGARVAFPVVVNGAVFALAADGPWVYLGGDFQTVNGASVPFAARVNATTGAVDATWRPAPNGDLIDIIPVAGSIVLNGSFSRVGGLPRGRLAMVSAGGAGQPLEGWRCDANEQVDRLYAAGGWLYAGGRFSRIGGIVRSNLVRINPVNGTVDGAWSPAPNGPVFDLSADSTHLYLAGGFTTVGGSVAAFAARIPLSGATADASWAPQPDSLCARICVSGDSVYVSGNFTSISGLGQSYLARIPRTGGTADGTWKPPIDGALLALVPDGANGCWGGGRFDSNGSGSGFARFSKTQGTAAPAYAATIENTGAVKVIKPNPVSGGWFIGGDFDMVNGTKKHALFRLLPGGTVDASWSAGLRGYYTEVNALDITGNNLLAGGQFEVPGLANELLYNCLLINIGTGQAITNFKPNPSSTVYSIVPQSGAWLVGGLFNLIGGENISYIARIGANGNAEALFDPKPDGAVHAILNIGSELYLAGEFTGFTSGAATIPAPYLARLVNLTPDLAWQPRPNQAVFSLAATGNYLYAGGRFTSMARLRRKYLAQIPQGGAGTPTTWNPAPDDEVRSLRIDGTTLYAGGAFFTIGGYRWPKLARFPLTGLNLDTAFRTSGENGAVFAIEPQAGGNLLVGGSFNGWDDDYTKRSLVSIGPGGGGVAPLALPTSLESSDLLADYFAPAAGAQLTPLPDGMLSWEENPVLPHGMVSRVQWSTDLETWHESGDTVNGTTVFISVAADDRRRTAQLVSDGPHSSIFLRVAVTAGENPPAQQRP